MGWPDSWGRKICGRLWQPTFDPWHPHRGRGALTPASCPLTGACKVRIYFSVQMCMFPCSFSHWKSALKQWYPIIQNQFSQSYWWELQPPGRCGNRTVPCSETVYQGQLPTAAFGKQLCSPHSTSHTYGMICLIIVRRFFCWLCFWDGVLLRTSSWLVCSSGRPHTRDLHGSAPSGKVFYFSTVSISIFLLLVYFEANHYPSPPPRSSKYFPSIIFWRLDSMQVFFKDGGLSSETVGKYNLVQ